MPSERVQRRIDRLLDQAEEAADNRDWSAVAESVRMVLKLDPENEDARAFETMVEESDSGASVATAVSLDPGASIEQAPERVLPEAFVDGRYQVTGFLGEGGRKQVYLAHDTRLNRDVAFAVIKSEGLDANGRQRIQREAEAMGRLSGHPHIVTIYDVGETDVLGETGGQPYIVSEYMAGGDVEALIAGADDHQLDLDRAIAIADQVAQALEQAHADGIVHRDLKPGNIWLAEDGTAKLGDFGLAFAASDTRMTTEGTMLGTVAYMPPEQALGNEVTPRSDLYALGCVLYELVTGHPPFRGDDAVAVISQHLNTAPVAPSWHREDCPPALETLILSLLEKAPEERPESAGDVQGSLETMDVSAPSASTEHHNPLERLARGVFVGRESEMIRLRRAFDNALGGHGELVMLVGEPGIGKTRTTLELETYARMRGAQVHWGRNHEGSGAPPFWPWIQVGRALGNAIGVGTDAAPLGGLGGNVNELVRLFPELREMLPNFQDPDEISDPDAAQFALFDAYAAFTRGGANIEPIVIVLDDLHWADKPSLLLLQHIARELASMRVLILGTFRDTDLVRTHPLSEALATLNRESGFERVVLRGLSRDEVRDYIKTAANVEPSRSVLNGIVEETEGNPFFLSEVVNLMAEEGTLSARSLSDIAIPDGVREALGRRLDRLSEEANALLQTASVVGREFPYDTLSALDPDGDDDVLLHLIEEGLEARVIEEMDQPGRYRFTHHLMQETLLKELSTTRRVRVHGQIGEALERRFGARAEERASRLAQHFVEASTLSERHAGKAVRYSKLSAKQAEAQSAWADAARHYEEALTVMSDADSGVDEDETALLVALGIAARHHGDNRTAWRSFMRSIDLLEARGDGNGVARTTLEALQIFIGPELAIPLADRALPMVEDEHLEALLLSRLLMAPPWRAALGERAIPFRDRARALAESHDYADVQPLLLYAEAFQLGESGGDPAAAGEMFREAGLAFEALGLSRDAADAYWGGAIWTLVSGKNRAGCEEMEFAVDYARKHRIRFFEENALQMLADQYLKAGDLEGAGQFEEQLRQAQGFTGPLHVARRYMLAGDKEEALRLLPGEESAGGVDNLLATLYCQRAAILFSLEEVEAAQTDFQRMIEALERVPRPAGEPFILPGSLRGALTDVGPALADDALVEWWYQDEKRRPNQISTPLERAVFQLRGNLARRLGLFDEAADWYRQGIEWGEREEAPIEAGHCWQMLAEVAVHEGDAAEALRNLEQAIAIFERYGIGLYLQQAVARRMELQGIADVDVTASIDLVAASIEKERPDLSTQTAPDGTVTLLFSDIENSTARTAELGDRKWMEVLRAHNAIVREALSANDGYEVKSMGDGFMLAFRSASDGVRCAIAMQQAFADHNAEAEQPIVVRIGLHTGEAIKDGDDFFGTHVNLAARVGGVAEGGEILISGLLRELTATSGEFRIGDSREVSLKGISGAQSVHAVEWH